MYNIFSKKKYYFLLGIFLTSTLTSLNHYSNAQSRDNLYLRENADLTSNQEIKIKYIVGPGDVLKITFKGIPLFNNNYIINPEGLLSLPEIDDIYVAGYDLEELKSLLIEKYQSILFDTSLKISVSKYRPVKFFLIGEINIPGLYTLEYKKFDSVAFNQSPNTVKEFSSDYGNTTSQILAPKLFDAIQLGGGFTNNADLSKINIIRKNTKSQGGGKIKASINLFSLLNDGDQNQNIRIYDGDSIIISRSNKSTLKQLIEINKTNITPLSIEVFVTGNVKKPGRTTLKKNSSLNSALASVGGQQNLTGNIEFIRLNENGKSDKRIFKYDYSAQKGAFNNPILNDGDIIAVKKNILGKSTDVLNEIASPILSGYGIYKLFD